MDVLIVDDDDDIRSMLGFLMQGRGWTVRVATSAEAALLELASSRPHLLLLDLSLPQRGGIALLRLLDRGLGRPSHVVLISALPQPAARAVARRHGLPYLSKPFSLDDLDRVLLDAASPTPGSATAPSAHRDGMALKD